MPRKQFVADLQNACAGVSIAGITQVEQGEDDGMFTFMCVAHGQQLRFSALVTDVSEYPSSHMYMIFAPDHAPASIANTLSAIADDAFGKPIQQLLTLVSRNLASTDTDGDQEMIDSQDYGDELEEEDSGEDVDDFYLDDEPVQTKYTPTVGLAKPTEGYAEPTSEFRSRIRSDLLVAKANGFKVGHLGGLMDGMGCFVSLSCRISKLGISEEAMQAWQIEPSEYLVVVFSYPNGYKTMESVKSYDGPTALRNFEMRVGISTTYKPTMQEAVDAFTVLSREKEKRREEDSQAEIVVAHKGFRDSFISRPLNELLNTRLPQLLKYRYNGMPWNGAEKFYADHIGTNIHSDLGLSDEYMTPEEPSAAYPPLVMADHIHESLHNNHSLPVVGMQFVLRHFVRCCEFCLICFSKMPDDLQAIKPYVCDNPLCLYQYMSLGFGPSIEHEILSQPKVVDLLVSFCYTSARMGKLKSFPTGLSLTVPPSVAYGGHYPTMNYAPTYGAAPGPPTPAAPEDDGIPMKFNAVTNEILFENKDSPCPVRTGDWVVIRTRDNLSKALHCRVANVLLYPTISVAEPNSPAVTDAAAAAREYPTSRAKPAAKALPETPADEFKLALFHKYDQNFDELDEAYKREAICALLDILPSVAQMRQYLIRKQQSSLNSWVDRVPTGALALLRWIIASNRACIMQVDEDPDKIGRKGQDRLYGMPGWSQFRFAMGAPDKERKFITAIRETTDRLQLKHPTLFAWHGSPLVNWHSIIREGLHFNDTAHGRAFGHGVYHSLDCNTSLGYSGGYYGAVGGSGYWPMSDLKISQAMALNEIVNAPGEFVSKTPHLVVAQLHWIQTRYLFVKTGNDYNLNSSTKIAETKPFDPIDQDQNYTPHGTGGKIIIPKSAIPGSRRPKKPGFSASKNKRQKISSGSSASNPIDLDAEDDDGASVATLEDDLRIFDDEDAPIPQREITEMGLPTPNSLKGKAKTGGILSKVFGSSSKSAKSFTDYEPGTLDYSTLPMLRQPAWATSLATKRLMKDFGDLLKVQNNEAPHELGWHIDDDKIENMYQWIVELHSFDPTLPLAKDMKTKNIKSIVLELRFGKDYPMSPPFVRVIRPRFLPFQAGGGGHVTAGGAMCMSVCIPPFRLTK
jgi:ubiquitin-conjugating enzyme E2 Q